MSITLLSSIDSHCRDTALRRLTDQRPHAAVLIHDLLEGDTVLRRLAVPGREPGRRGHKLEHGCLSCTVRLDIVPSVDELLGSGTRDIIVALPPSVGSDHVAAALERVLSKHRSVIANAVLAMDPAALEDHVWDHHSLFGSGLSSLPQDDRTAGEFLIHELSAADSAILTEGIFAHLAGEEAPACQAGGDLWVRGTALLAELAPHLVARHPDQSLKLGRHRTNRVRSRLAPGAVRVPQSSHPPFTTILLRAARPLHPQRFRQVLPQLSVATAWLRGTAWMADATQTRLVATGIGPRLWFESAGGWGHDQAGTLLALTGAENEQLEVEALLRYCELHDEEIGSVFGPALSLNPGLDAP